ncbi:MAG: MBL fold metallo-hydrolase [Fidelibacterota bacterium]|nr:MAG: MBL fold metallo-hydrolase [Candidatus Neomarinimicrobiota bacterium]
MRIIHTFILLAVVGCAANAPPEKEIIVTVLYDNYASVEGVEADWGFACLIQGLEKTILFDTGTQSEVLLRNAEQLNVDLETAEVIVISHEHRDHTGGLAAVLGDSSGATVYFPVSFTEDFGDAIVAAQGTAVRVSEPVVLFAGVSLTGEMGSQIKEQSLILETKEGLLIITGCSHQGIVEILERATEIHEQDIHLVAGGFHLLNHTEADVGAIIQRFRELGVEKCGATHCTGGGAIEQFEEAYGEDFISMGVGKVLRIPY